MRRIDEKTMLAAIWGGAFLGGGGGGDPKAGYMLGKKALEEGEVNLALPDELPRDAFAVTAGLVGSPKAGGLGPSPESYVDAFLLLQKAADIKVAAVNANEAGGVATVNGWLQAAVLGVPVLDAPCNGRAHPTGLMGAMGLHRDGSYISRQAAAGRKSKMYVEGDINEASAVIRAYSAREGLVAVARNPVTCDYVSRLGARGAVTQAIELGLRMAQSVRDVLGYDPLQPENVGGLTGVEKDREGWAPDEPGIHVARAAADFLKGQVALLGRVKDVTVEVKGGFDVGNVVIQSESGVPGLIEKDPDTGGDWTISFMNEYLTLEKDGNMVYSFPDLITLVDPDSSWPISSADLKKGRRVIVVGVPREGLILGEGMFDASLYRPLEEATGRKFNVPEGRRSF